MKGRKMDRLDRWKMLHGGPDGPSLDAVRKKVTEGLQKLYAGAKSKDGKPSLSLDAPYIKELFPHKVVFEHGGKLKARRYECESGKAPSFDEEYEVEPHYKPVGKHA